MKKLMSIFSIVLFLFMILLSGKLMIQIVRDTEDRNKEHDRVEAIQFIGNYSVEGQEYRELTDNADVEIRKNQTITLVGGFEKIIEEKDILFTLKNFSFSMKINGVLVAEHGQPGTFPAVLKSAGFARYTYSVERITPEDLVEIELVYPYDQGGRTALYEFINLILIGEKADFYKVYIKKQGIPILLVSTILLVGFCLLTASVLLKLWKNKRGLQLIYFSAFMINCAIWFLMDTFYTSTNVVIPYETVINVIDMINLLLLPLIGVCFLSSYLENEKARIIASGIKLVQLIVITGIILMQSLGIWDMYESQIISIPVNAVTALIIFVMGVYEMLVGRNKRIKSAVIAIIPTAIGIYSDILIHFTDPRNYQYLFRLGFLLTCCIHFINSLKVLKESVEAKEREQQLKEQMTSLKVSIMLSQIQPHFLYNALNAIQYICMEDAKKAAKAIEQFSKYLRGNMDSLKQKELIPFDKELSHLENYLYIEKLRFEERVKIEYNLKVTDFLVPCLVIQPIVENAIRYGITRKVEGGTVRIATLENEKDIVISISDDGVGFDPRETQYDNRSHIGIDNVRDRLDLQCNGRLNIESITDVGTTITINIPKEGVLML